MLPNPLRSKNLSPMMEYLLVNILRGNVFLATNLFFRLPWLCSQNIMKYINKHLVCPTSLKLQCSRSKEHKNPEWKAGHCSQEGKQEENCKHERSLGLWSSTLMGPKSASETTGQSAIVYTKNHPKGLGVRKVVGKMLLFTVNLRPYPNLAILFFL